MASSLDCVLREKEDSYPGIYDPEIEKGMKKLDKAIEEAGNFISDLGAVTVGFYSALKTRVKGFIPFGSYLESGNSSVYNK